MLSAEFHKVKISSIVCAVPQNSVSTDSFIDVFGEETVNRFKNVIGISNRYHVNEKQTASDLCYVAAKKLMEHKGLKTDDIDALVFITQSPDYTRPSTAFVLQGRLGLKEDCIVFDVNLGCSAFINGVQIVSSMIECGAAKKALLLIGDAAISQEPSEDDRSFQIMFGDAGSATLIESGEGIVRTMIRSKGEDYKTIITPLPGSRLRNVSSTEIDSYKKRMNGEDTFLFSITKVPKLFKEFYKTFNCTQDDFDYFIFHQANLLILQQVMKRLKLPLEKVPISIDRYGNTDGVSNLVTIAYLREKLEDNKVLRFIACGFGIGLSWGIVSFEINSNDILPMIFTDEFYEEGMIL